MLLFFIKFLRKTSPSIKILSNKKTKVQIFLDYSRFYHIFASNSLLKWQKNTTI